MAKAPVSCRAAFTISFADCRASGSAWIRSAPKSPKESGRVYAGVCIVSRTTFVIGADGAVVKVFEKVKPLTHADDVLAALAAA